jgi:hypothetical protein
MENERKTWFDKLPAHAILLSIYPIMYLFAHNLVFIQIQEVIRSLTVSVGITVFFLIGFWIILKSWEKAGLLSSLLVLLFYSFGHVANALSGSFSVQQLAWAWVIAFLFFSFLIINARLPEKTTLFFNAIAAVFLLFPVTTITSTLYTMNHASSGDQEKLSQLRGEAEAESTITNLSRSELPDIYYIILDGYERADKLDELYAYDNSAFLETLEQRGFFIASASHSNYLNTTYSLNTSLNLTYFHKFPKNIFKTARYNLQTNYLNDFLRQNGYQVVLFDSGTGDTNNQVSDQFISPIDPNEVGQKVVNRFEQLLIRTTFGLVFIQKELPEFRVQASETFINSVNQELDLRRERIRSAFAHLPDYAAKEGPYFLFAHIYLPHMPFLYGPGGEELKYNNQINLYWYETEPEDYIQYYAYQIDYLNKIVSETIDRILSLSTKPVVIILQADHGDDKYLNWEAPNAQGIDARSAILNAIYFSDGATESFYPTITPVNTFRLVLNHWFGTQFPLLPDLVYAHEHPLDTPPNKVPEFQDACVQYNICLPDYTD